MPVRSEEGILVLTPAERNIYARFARLLNTDFRQGIIAGHNNIYLDFLRDNNIKHDVMKQICKISESVVDYGKPFVKFKNDKSVSINGVFYLTTDGKDNHEYGFDDNMLPSFDIREQIEIQKRQELEQKEQEKLRIEQIKAQIIQKNDNIAAKKEELEVLRQKREYEKTSGDIALANSTTRTQVNINRCEKHISTLEQEKQDLINSLPDEEKNKMFPKSRTKTRTNDIWSKQDVIKLLTVEAHKVGRMLGSGYDLFEPIHGEWISRWLLNPEHVKVMVHQAHRGSFKSTCLRLFTAIFMILFPMRTIIIIRKSEDAVKELIQGISAILETPLFHTFVNILYPDIQAKGGFKKTTDTALILDTNLNLSLSGEPQIRALGLGSSLTGKHSSMIITDDICFTAGTKIATPKGDINIEDLKVGDEILTPFGYEKITKTFSREAPVITRCGLEGTSNHPVYNKNTNNFDNLDIIEYDNLSRLCLGELIKWQIIKKISNGIIENGLKQEETISYSKHLMDKGLVRCCTEQYGKNIMGKYLPTMLFIIKTIIPITIALKIWFVYLLKNIKVIMQEEELKNCVLGLKKKQDQHTKNGQKQKRVENVVLKTSKRLMKHIEKILLSLFVKNVGLNTEQILKEQQDCAENAEKEQPQENTTSDKKIKTVYNIETEKEHVYYANGILVHNCVDKDRESPAEREYTKAKYREMMNIMQDGKGFEDSWILNIGTPWHEEDVFSLMDKGLPAKSDKQIELEKIPQKKRTEEQNEQIRHFNMLRGKFVYNCYQTGLMTQKDIDWKHKSLNDDALFAANYMLNLVSDDECPFPRIDNVGNYTKSYFAEAWEVFAQLDCSYGGEDSTALSIGCHNWETNQTIVYGRMWHKTSIDENYLEIAEVLYDNHVQTLFLESNADKGLMGQKFRELGFNVVSYHEHTNKDIKITSTIRPFWREKGDELLPSVQFVAETDQDYLAQIHDYKKGVRHDDAPDSLACLLLYSKFGSLPIRVT